MGVDGWENILRVGVVVCMSGKFNVGACRCDMCFTKQF